LSNANVNCAITFKPYSSKSTNEKILYYNVWKSSRDKLQEYVLKNGSSI